MADEDASNGSYVISAPGIESLSEAPQNDSSLLRIDFSISIDTTYYIYGRINNTAPDGNAFWIKIDDDEYELINGLTTTGWQWVELISYELTTGSHSISLAIAEDSVSLDKIVIKSFQVAPVDLGEIANNICEPEIYVFDIDDNHKHNGYTLGQNYPNPFTKRTFISFEIRKTTHVSLKIFDVYGTEVAELAGKEFQSGSHTLEFSNEMLPPGNYFYTIRTEEFFTTRKMVVFAN